MRTARTSLFTKPNLTNLSLYDAVYAHTHSGHAKPRHAPMCRLSIPEKKFPVALAHRFNTTTSGDRLPPFRKTFPGPLE